MRASCSAQDISVTAAYSLLRRSTSGYSDGQHAAEVNPHRRPELFALSTPSRPRCRLRRVAARDQPPAGGEGGIGRLAAQPAAVRSGVSNSVPKQRSGEFFSCLAVGRHPCMFIQGMHSQFQSAKPSSGRAGACVCVVCHQLPSSPGQNRLP